MSGYASRFNASEVLRSPAGELEQLICEQLGLDLKIVSGAGSDQKPGSAMDPLRVFFSKPPRTGVSIASQLAEVVVAGEARWGNQVIKLIQAIEVARLLSIPKVRIATPEGFPERFSFEGVVVAPPTPTPPESALVGRFFYSQTLRPVLEKGRTREQTLQALRPYIQIPIEDALAQDSNTLVVYVRSGDVYRTKRRPHPLYGQPPLAFYRRVLESRRWSRVIIVTQDSRSPVIRGIKRLSAKRAPEVLCRGESLLDALATILSAQNLVIARGTFAYPLVALGTGPKNVYSFGSSEFELWGFSTSRVAVHQFDERSHLYRLLVTRKWKNTRFQRVLMKAWPRFAITQTPFA